MKQPLAIWITDLHLSPNTIKIVDNIADQVIMLCQQIENPVVIIGGDVFNSRSGQPQSVLTAFSELLNKFATNGVQVICIAGNHDRCLYTSEESYLDAYEGREGFTLFKGYSSLNVSEYGMKFHFISYFDEKLLYSKYLQQAIANIEFDLKNILFTHIAISGVRNNDGSEIKNELNAQSFQHFHKVIVGHYHNRQVFDNIIYSGSAYQANHGEDNVKGCTIIYTDGSQQFVQLSFPEYRTHQLSLSQLATLDASNWSGNHRIKLSGKPNIEQSKKIQQLEAQGIKVEYQYEVTTQLGNSNDIKTQFTNEDILAYFSEWCNEEQIEDKEYGLKQLNAIQ